MIHLVTATSVLVSFVASLKTVSSFTPKQSIALRKRISFGRSNCSPYVWQFTARQRMQFQLKDYLWKLHENPIVSESSTFLDFFKCFSSNLGSAETQSMSDDDGGEQNTERERELGPAQLESVPKAEPELEPEPEDFDICVVGGGVSGLTAAFTAAEALSASERTASIVLVEAEPTLGGRVQSDKTRDGYILDRGFAVFIEKYPMARKLLNYDKLELGMFQPGALVKTKGKSTFSRVADPLRQPKDVFVALFAPVGSFTDKIKLLPLLNHVRRSSISELFDEEETDTLTCLQNRYGFSCKFIHQFMSPFLEGIYLSPLNEQSSRMFHFVFKMFSEGAACLPAGGIGAVADQLAERTIDAGVKIRVSTPVSDICVCPDGSGFILETAGDHRGKIRARSVVLATDGEAAQRLISKLPAFESLASKQKQPQRSVGCLYYGINSEPPVKDPILILNGDVRDEIGSPINNLCFPSVVNKGYAPAGQSLCSVTILKPALEHYRGKTNMLDEAVRKQLALWFPDQASAIMNKWELKGMYDIQNAQPGQFEGPQAANISGGRDCSSYRGNILPRGFVVCGDHMATATLNGAMESGVSAGCASVKLL